MKKVINWLSNNLDKVAHFAISIVLTIVFGAIFFHTTAGATILNAAVGGAFASLGLGIAKEVYDYIIVRNLDLKDLLADLIGSAVGVIILCLIYFTTNMRLKLDYNYVTVINFFISYMLSYIRRLHW